jgi:hypothetical protein
MTVITMSRTEIDRMSVLHDLADGRIKVAEASTLMGLGRRQVFRLAKAYGAWRNAKASRAALLKRKTQPLTHRNHAPVKEATTERNRANRVSVFRSTPP